MKPLRKKAKAPESKRPVIELAPSEYQPSKAELEEEIPLPGASLAQVRRAFLRPFKILRRDQKHD